MIYQYQEPVRGEPALIVDGKSWVFAPSGHIRPFDRKIRIQLLEHLDNNRVLAQWANQGTYTLRYGAEAAEQIQTWKVGSRHRVQMWGDCIERVLPKSAKDD